MKKTVFNLLLSAVLGIATFVFAACSDDNLSENKSTPVPGTVDSILWPFDACIDSTKAPGDDFYAYIATGYTTNYGMGVMPQQGFLGAQFREQELNNPSSETMKKLRTYRNWDMETLKQKEKTAMLSYFAKVDTMSGETMLCEIIRNSMRDDKSYMKTEISLEARKQCIGVLVADTLSISPYVYESYGQLIDTTAAYIEELADQVHAINKIIDRYTPKEDENDEQAKYIKSVFDPTYTPMDLDISKVKMLRKPAQKSLEYLSYAQKFVLSSLGLCEDEVSMLVDEIDNIYRITEEILYFMDDEVKIMDGLRAYLKISRLMSSADFSTDYFGYPLYVINMDPLNQAPFTKLLMADDYCTEKITAADIQNGKDLANQFRSTFRSRLDSLDWMSPSTKTYAKTKLDSMKFWFGLPKSDIRHFDVTIEDADIACAPSECKRILSERFYNDIVLPTLHEGFSDDYIYLMLPLQNEMPYTANAFYDTNNNTMLILASNLISPICRNDVSLAYNYAVLGATTLGHEMCHGFDAEGSTYDEKGNLYNWWTVSDALKYKEKQQQLTNIFDQYIFTGADGKQFYVNGSQTLVENMADYGGLTIGLDALCRLRKAQGYDEAGLREQMRRYFLSWAIGWSENKAYDTEGYGSDEHAPNFVRAIAPCTFIDEWYDIFGVKWGDKYYLEPSQRAKLW